ncbi:hypothetical protein Rleg10DRAFT_3667 [Rhizobium leguminosarum bv. trifolii WSM2012]|nr:hypothetical protein Rleg10DRAFT_3667 [Rhizobium leguminosarum bv. trifolii WSM2012]
MALDGWTIAAILNLEGIDLFLVSRKAPRTAAFNAA